MRAVAILASLLVAVALPARADDEAMARARAHYARGNSEYTLGHYDEAIRAFEAAYRERPAPALLYNIGQAHRKAGRPGQAIEFFRRYLDLGRPTPAERAEVEREIAGVEKEQAEAAARPRAPSAATGKGDDLLVMPAGERSEAPGPPPARPWYKRWWVWTVAGAVVAGAAVGAGVGVALSSPRDAQFPASTLGAQEFTFR